MTRPGSADRNFVFVCNLARDPPKGGLEEASFPKFKFGFVGTTRGSATGMTLFPEPSFVQDIIAFNVKPSVLC